jgi:hypothetical protein
VQRALSRVGERGYSLTGWNCEHFAAWCATGVAASQQVVDWISAETGAEYRPSRDRSTSAAAPDLGAIPPTVRSAWLGGIRGLSTRVCPIRAQTVPISHVARGHGVIGVSHGKEKVYGSIP